MHNFVKLKLPVLLRLAEDRVEWRRLVDRCIASTAPGYET